MRVGIPAMFALLVVTLVSASRAEASVVTFKNGRSIKVDGVRRLDDSSVQLMLNGGATMTVRAAEIDRVGDDELLTSEWVFQTRGMRFTRARGAVRPHIERQQR